MRDRMQQSRFELKYLISEETALRVRDFLQTYIHMGYIDVDEYSVGKPNLSYPAPTSIHCCHLSLLFSARVRKEFQFLWCWLMMKTTFPNFQG